MMRLPKLPADRWAWPAGAHDLLLRAVLTPDPEAALAAGRAWLDANDIDTAGFREHRLLAALAQRFGGAIADHPAYPRLLGLSRQLWVRSQMALRDALPALAQLSAAMPVLLMKGASRIAADPAAARGRVAHDIDVLVPPGRMAEALDILAAAGWQAAHGASLLRLKAMGPALRAMNFFKGNFGDIDLHQLACHPVHASAAAEAALWARAVPVTFQGLRLFVPAPADRAVLAIAHGGLDAHAHSDWLVDCAAAMADPGFVASDFAAAIRQRRLEAAAALTLGYLEGPVGRPPLPGGLAQALSDEAAHHPFARLAALVQAKPRDDLRTFGQLARGLAKLWRIGVQPAAARRIPRLRGHGRGTASADGGPPHALLVQLGPDLPARLRLEVALPAIRRRVEFELNAPGRHLASLTYRNLRRRARRAILEFPLPAMPAATDGPLTLEARPLRALRPGDGPEMAARYGALPFRLLRHGTG